MKKISTHKINNEPFAYTIIKNKICLGNKNGVV